MPFKPGHNLSKGRPKGASNKSTETIKRKYINALRKQHSRRSK